MTSAQTLREFIRLGAVIDPISTERARAAARQLSPAYMMEAEDAVLRRLEQVGVPSLSAPPFQATRRVISPETCGFPSLASCHGLGDTYLDFKSRDPVGHRDVTRCVYSRPGMDLRTYTRQYAVTDNRLASLSYFGTFAVYFASLYLAIVYMQAWYVMIPAGVVHAFSAVRLYVLQHDCGHHSLFETRQQNEWAGHGLSPFTFAPFEVMKQNHNLHHAGVGNLDHRETGEINTMTLREWNAAGFWTRLQYRLYRNPFVLIPVGAFFTYFIRYRWPKNTTRFGVVGVLLHNLSILVWLGVLYVLSGWAGLGVYFAFSMVGGMLGVFLVYLQHNFEDTYWDRRPDLNPTQAALQGSSCLDFGAWFDHAVACITLHDIHHFNARIPSYRLRACHYNMPDEFALRRIKFPEAVAALNLKLWDEDQQRLVPFPKSGVTSDADGAAQGA